MGRQSRTTCRSDARNLHIVEARGPYGLLVHRYMQVRSPETRTGRRGDAVGSPGQHISAMPRPTEAHTRGCPSPNLGPSPLLRASQREGPRDPATPTGATRGDRQDGE